MTRRSFSTRKKGFPLIGNYHHHWMVSLFCEALFFSRYISGILNIKFSSFFSSSLMEATFKTQSNCLMLVSSQTASRGRVLDTAMIASA